MAVLIDELSHSQSCAKRKKESRGVRRHLGKYSLNELIESGLSRHEFLMTAAIAALGPKLCCWNECVLADGCPDLDCGFLSWMVLWEVIQEEK